MTLFARTVTQATVSIAFQVTISMLITLVLTAHPIITLPVSSVTVANVLVVKQVSIFRQVIVSHALMSIASYATALLQVNAFTATLDILSVWVFVSNATLQCLDVINVQVLMFAILVMMATTL